MGNVGVTYLRQHVPMIHPLQFRVKKQDRSYLPKKVTTVSPIPATLLHCVPAAFPLIGGV